jgi:hypothetical protein
MGCSKCQAIELCLGLRFNNKSMEVVEVEREGGWKLVSRFHWRPFHVCGSLVLVHSRVNGPFLLVDKIRRIVLQRRWRL